MKRILIVTPLLFSFLSRPAVASNAGNVLSLSILHLASARTAQLLASEKLLRMRAAYPSGESDTRRIFPIACKR